MNMFAEFNELQLMTVKNALLKNQRHLRQAIADIERSPFPASKETEILQTKLSFQVQLKTSTELIAEIDALITLRKYAATS